MRYIVTIGYYSFMFEDPKEALNFAKMAKIKILDNDRVRDIKIEVLFEDELKEEE